MTLITGITAERMQEIIDRVETDTPYARVKKSAVQSISSGVETALSFDSEDFDNNNIHDPAVNNTRLVCPKTGIYVISGTISWASSASSYRELSIRKNGSTRLIYDDRVVPTGAVYLSFSTIARLVATDYVEALVWQGTGSPLNVNFDYSHFQMARMGV